MKIGEIEIRRIGLGTNRLTNTEQNRGFVREAVSDGINLIDTAHVYADGESELTLGAAFEGPPPDGCLIATKGGLNDGRAEVLRAEIEESLKRLRTEKIGLYYLHNVDPEVPIETSLSVIAEYRDAGTIEQIGVSNVDLEQLRRAQQVVPIAAVQNRYNLAMRSSDEVVDYCAEHQIAFVTHGPLRERNPELERIASAHDATPSQVTLAWLLGRSPAMLPIPGTLSIEHVRENLASLELQLSDEEQTALR